MIAVTFSPPPTIPLLFLGGSLVSHHPLPHFSTDPENVKLRGNSDCSLSDTLSLPERPRTALLPTRCHCPRCSFCRSPLPCTLSSTLAHPPVGPLPRESSSCMHAHAWARVHTHICTHTCQLCVLLASPFRGGDLVLLSFEVPSPLLIRNERGRGTEGDGAQIPQKG